MKTYRPHAIQDIAEILQILDKKHYDMIDYADNLLELLEDAGYVSVVWEQDE